MSLYCSNIIYVYKTSVVCHLRYGHVTNFGEFSQKKKKNVFVVSQFHQGKIFMLGFYKIDLVFTFYPPLIFLPTCKEVDKTNSSNNI